MCGRFSLTSTSDEILDLFDQTLPEAIKPSPEMVATNFSTKRWQIAPNDWVSAIFHTGFTKAHWWLLPSWTAQSDFKWRKTDKGEKSFTWSPGKRFSHFNCRQDTITDPTRKYWFGLLGTQRCVIPANGFIEWSDDEMLKKNPGAKKRSALYQLKDQKPFFFAGLFDVATDDQGAPFPSVNIITTRPNELLSALPHHRMPAILRREDVSRWMDPTVGSSDAAKLICPTPAEEMRFHFLGPLINKASNDVPEALEAVISSHS